MGDHRLPKRVMSGELVSAGKRGPGGRRKSGRTAWKMIFGFGVTGDWRTAALEPGAWETFSNRVDWTNPRSP